MLTGIFENGASVIQSQRTANSVEVHQNRKGLFEVRHNGLVLMTRDVIEWANAEASDISEGLAKDLYEIDEQGNVTAK
jgi:thiamine monophosphate kinase